MAKISVYPLLYNHRKDKNGMIPVAIRVTRGGKTVTDLALGRKVASNDWNVEKKTCKDKILNALIQKEVRRIMDEITRLRVNDQPVTDAVIKFIVKGKGMQVTVKEFTLDIMQTWAGKKSTETIRIYKTELDKLLSFGGQALCFEDITPAWLRRYEAHLIALGNMPNTIHKAWKCLRKIINDAIKEGVTKLYPFANYDNPVYQQTDRTYLTEQEVNQVQALLLQPLPDILRRAVLYFLLGCYSGLRVSDWEKFDETKMVHEGRLLLRTKKNKEIVSFAITRPLAQLLQELNNQPMGMDRHTCNRYLKVAGSMAGLTKVLTNHVARHSFAVRCAELGISIETTANLMGITVKSCGYYYRVTNRKTDVEMDKWNK
jgi:site-specific recombinase XerD